MNESKYKLDLVHPWIIVAEHCKTYICLQLQLGQL